MATAESTEITPRELFERVVSRGEAPPILDVRNEDEFAGWKILYYSEGPEPGRTRRSARIIARRA